MINRLVVNGCSYMHVYAEGNGQDDLASNLGIQNAVSLAQSGCSNSRILRTTLKDSYETTEPTMYVLGLTFIHRYELPILKCDDEESSFEGRWTNPQNQLFQSKWEHFWKEEDTDNFVELTRKAYAYGLLDNVEDLMYKMLSIINDLESRGHRVLMFQQADDGYRSLLKTPRLYPFKSKKNIINGFNWRSIPWQHAQGVPISDGMFENKYGTAPKELRHRKSGAHQVLNGYLTNYINEHKILD